MNWVKLKLCMKDPWIQLYNHDFRKFIEYNRQDVALLDKLDKKLKFIDLTNELAHANTVLSQTTLGAVAVTEQAINNEAHRRGLQVPNRSKEIWQAVQLHPGVMWHFPKRLIQLDRINGLESYCILRD